jgi:pilus assembly protein Flp/PilA
MNTLLIGIRRFLREEKGANAVEYSLLAGLIAIAIVVGASTLGGNINTFLDNVAKCVQTPNQTNCTAPFTG